MDMHEGGFKFDIDALTMEYGHLFDVLAGVVAGGERTLLQIYDMLTYCKVLNSSNYNITQLCSHSERFGHQ